jgi:hypothetical protein
MARLKNFSELSLKKVTEAVHSADKKPEKYRKPDGRIGIRMVPMDKEVVKREAVHSADKKPEKYRKPDGKIGIRMVPMDKEVVKREAIVDPNDLKGRPKKADPNPESPYGIKHPLHPANLKKKQTKESIDNHPKVKAARKAHAAGTWNGNVNKEGEAVVHINGKPHTVTNKSKTKNLRKEEQNGLMKEESVDQLDEKLSAFSKVLRKNKKLISHDHNTVYTNYKFYVIIDYDNLADLSAMDSERIFKNLKKNKGIGYPQGDITCHFKTAKDARQFVDDMGGPSSFRGKFGRLDVVGESVDEATWPDEMPPIDEKNYTYFNTKDDAHAHAKKHGGKVYTNSGKGATTVKGKPVNTHVVIKDDVDVDEALNMSQRIKKSRIMKRMKARIKIGRERAKRKMAPKDKLEKRANRQARNQIASKLTRGIPKRELSFARKQEIEKRLDKPALKQRIKRLAKRLFKDVRKKEVQRKKG